MNKYTTIFFVILLFIFFTSCSKENIIGKSEIEEIDNSDTEHSTLLPGPIGFSKNSVEFTEAGGNDTIKANYGYWWVQEIQTKDTILIYLEDITKYEWFMVEKKYEKNLIITVTDNLSQEERTMIIVIQQYNHFEYIVVTQKP